MPSVRTWRLVKQKYAETAYDGRGAALAGGRWNSRGHRLVYTSSTLSLALLEMLVHIDPDMLPPTYAAVAADIPDDLIIHADDAFPGWQSSEPQFHGRAGDRWLESGRSLAVIVPSAVVREECNLLINPLHPQFDAIALAGPAVFEVDARLRRELRKA